jgi:YHS domain-containing protein
MMNLSVLEPTEAGLRAGYSCPCGCTPSVSYVRGADPVKEGCCCGNEFAVGPQATARLAPKSGFASESQAFLAPWGEALQAAWLVGPSVHGPAEHGHGHEGASSTHEHASAVDPVCGMTVEPEIARQKGLHSIREGTDYFFCGQGCKLEFDDDPERFLQPSYVPSM